MDKQAVLEQIKEEAFRGEMEKISKMSDEEMISLQMNPKWGGTYNREKVIKKLKKRNARKEFAIGFMSSPDQEIRNISRAII